MNLSATELVDAAKQIEAAGEAYYAAALARLKNGRVREVFAWLRAEEARHSEAFEGLLSGLAGREADWRQDEQYVGHLRAMIDGRVFPGPAAARAAAEAVADDDAAVEMAIGFEGDTIRYFEAIRELVAEADRPLVDSLIAEERSHIEALEALRARRG
jgi:rubrerythrin